MSFGLIFALIGCSTILEILFTRFDSRYGLIFSLASFFMIKVDSRLIFLSFALVALHIFVVSFANSRCLQLTSEACERRGFIELQQYNYDLRIAQEVQVIH